LDEQPLDPKTLETLTAIARAQEDANRLKQSELNLKRRQETAILEQIASTQHLQQDIRELIRENRQLLDYFRNHALKDDAAQDIYENISERMERLERNLLLIFTQNNPKRSQEAQAELEIELAIKTELRKRQRNLNKLQNRAAEYGAIDVPLELQNRIEAEMEAIEKLKGELNA
jgi:hypothetical protein